MSQGDPRLESLFAAAAALPAAERAAYLDAACGLDPALRARADELLRAHARPGHLLDLAVTTAPPGEQCGDVIGPFKLVERIGEGGMGAVWMAQQHEPVKRLVALKLIKAGMDSRQVIARFEAERQALALMDHPNIARVLDAGTTPAGRPFFVMDLVKGVPITRYCDEHRLSPRQRLELFIPVCHAVQHAHQKGIIHRDLKPSNVLIASYDGKPVPKVIDFGVAKATGQQLTDKTLVTGFGAVVGTPEYMSPEQAEVNQLDIDTRSDVYSLGVILYELLAGSPPFSRADLEKAGMLEMLRIIREREPTKPSTKLSTSEGLPTLAANRGTEPSALAKLVRGELDWIVMKALEKERSRRYETANGFAMDVQRYLMNEPVLACPPSTAYKLKKFARRNRGALFTATIILILLIAGVTGTTIGLFREAAQRRIADAEKTKAQQAEADTLADYRASTDDAIELIGSKPTLGPKDKAYMEKTLKRWQAFAARQGDDERSQVIRAEGHFRVAQLFEKLGQHDAARTEFETARGLLKKLAADFPAEPEYQHKLATTHSSVGDLLSHLGQHDAARTQYETARDLRKRVADSFPAEPKYECELAGTQTSFGAFLHDLGEYDAARAAYESGGKLFKHLAEAFPGEPRYQFGLAATHANLGTLMADLGQREASRAEHEKARDVLKKLTAIFPSEPEYRNHLAISHFNLCKVLADLGLREVARAECETARDFFKELAAAFPSVPKYQSELSKAHSLLGLQLTGLGQRETARAEYETALDISKRLAVAFPSVPDYQRDLANVHGNLGLFIEGQGEHDAACAEYEEACRLRKKLVADSLAIRADRRDLGGNYCNLGDAARKSGKPVQSLTCFHQAIDILDPLYKQDARDTCSKLFLRNSYFHRAEANSQMEKYADALKDWDRAIELSDKTDQHQFRSLRAICKLDLGRVDEAVAEADELTKAPAVAASGSPNWTAGQYYNFAEIYAIASGKFADKKIAYANRAMELLQQAVKAGWKDAVELKEDSDFALLRDRADFKKLVADLEKKKQSP